jgi:hypothetical protein
MKLFHENEKIICIKIVNEFIVLRYQSQARIHKMKKILMCEDEILRITAPSLKILPKMLDIPQTHVIEREIILEQPERWPNHVIHKTNGTFQQYHVVEFMMSRILSGMKSNSKRRGHSYDEPIAKQKLFNAFRRLSADLSCGCRRLDCNEVLDLYGPNKLSPDRTYDIMGYCDMKQKIVFVVKSHNCSIKFDNIATERKSPHNWIVQTAAQMATKFKKRIKSLEIDLEKRSEFDKQQVKRFRDEQVMNVEHYRIFKDVLQQMKDEQKCQCEKCKRQMYFGDCAGILRKSHEPTQASPDRIDNNNVFYDKNNMRLVCQSCNHNENHQGRRHVEHKIKQDPIPLTKALVKECQKYLQTHVRQDKKTKNLIIL